MNKNPTNCRRIKDFLFLGTLRWFQLEFARQLQPVLSERADHRLRDMRSSGPLVASLLLEMAPVITETHNPNNVIHCQCIRVSTSCKVTKNIVPFIQIYNKLQFFVFVDSVTLFSGFQLLFPNELMYSVLLKTYCSLVNFSLQLFFQGTWD